MLALVVGLLTVSAATPTAGAASTTFLTTGITQSGMKQVTISVYEGVLVNFTNSYSVPMSTFVYLDLASSGGQTVYWNVGTCNFAANQLVQCFVVIAPSVPKGTYTASVFVTTNSSVPISTTSTLHLTL